MIPIREKEAIFEQESQDLKELKEQFKIINNEISNLIDVANEEVSKVEKRVKEIDKSMLLSLNSYAKPTKFMRIALEGVCLILGIDYNWQQAKSLVSDYNKFILSLTSYSLSELPEERMNALIKLGRE